MKTPAKIRRPRSDSVTAAVQALRSPRTAITAPAHLCMRPSDKPFFDAILTGRARDEWRSVDLVLAVQLARVQADIESEGATLAAEGAIIRKPNGAAAQNPRGAVVEILIKREQALMRTLRMGGKIAGRQSSLLSGRALERDADELRDALDNDEGGLLAH